MLRLQIWMAIDDGVYLTQRRLLGLLSRDGRVSLDVGVARQQREEARLVQLLVDLALQFNR